MIQSNHVIKWNFRWIVIPILVFMSINFMTYTPDVLAQNEGEGEFSTYLGGSMVDRAEAITTDSENNIIVIGHTQSSDFPTLNAYNSTFGGIDDVFVSKFSSTGDLLWSTFLGGEDTDRGRGIFVDPFDNIFITGRTQSLDFPLANNSNNGFADIFIAKMNPEGTLLWSYYLGGSNTDTPTDIAVDQNGDIIIVGYTASTDYPTVNEIDNSLNSTFDIVVTKITRNGNINWSTYIGGAGFDIGAGIVTDSQNNIIVTGITQASSLTNMTTLGPTTGFGYNCVLLKFSPLGNLTWGILYGGTQEDYVLDVAVDSNDNIYTSGESGSTDFPLLNGDNTLEGTRDAYVMRFSASGDVQLSTFFGGDGSETAMGIAIDSNNNFVIAGMTSSTNLPTMNAYNATFGAGIAAECNCDAYVSKFSPEGTQIWGTYFGGSADDAPISITLDTLDNVAFTGTTSSSNLPMVNSFNDTYSGLDNDVMVVKLSHDGQFPEPPPPSENSTPLNSSSSSILPPDDGESEGDPTVGYGFSPVGSVVSLALIPLIIVRKLSIRRRD